jgi:hypothetical protein
MWVLAALSSLFAILGLVEAWRDSPTVDEPIYLSSGLTAVTRHEFRFNVETGPLPKVLAALPALAAHPIIPDGKIWDDANGPAITNRFLAAQTSEGKLRRVFFFARTVTIAEGILAGVVAYALAAGLFGRAAGLLAAGLWLTTGFVLGLSHLVGIDVANALVTLTACLCLSRYLRRPSGRGAALVGVMGGVALLTRATGLLLVGALVVGVVLGAGRPVWRALARGAAVFLIAWAAVWVGVRLVAPSTPPKMTTSAFCFPKDSLPERMLDPVPWPQEYERAFSFHFACSTQTGGKGMFLLGHHWEGARWWYWPGSMIVKLPATVLAVMAAGLLSWITLDRTTAWRAFLAVALPMLVDTVFNLQVPKLLGLRYLLPSIALAMVAGSALARVVRTRRMLVLSAGVLAVVQLGFLVDAFPHSLSWTAPPFRPGYRAVSAADIDWGQHLYRMERWAEGKDAFVAYYGPVPGDFPGTRPLLGTDLRRVKGWVAVSAAQLTRTNRVALEWLRAYCPVDTLGGGSVLIYRFDAPPEPGPGPATPAGLCPGGSSRRT